MSPNDEFYPLALARRVAIVLVGAVLALAIIGSGRAYAAAGNFTIKTPEVDEKGGEWHVKVRIDLTRPPPMMHTPMRLVFSQEAVDERAIMTKGAEPVHTRMVNDTPSKQIVSMDVDFADGSGKVFKSTYFEFDLRRANGYFVAGEYLVSLSGPDGEVGVAQKLVLKGDNPPVYRGAMDFSDPKSNKSNKTKGPKMESVDNGLDGGSQKVAQNDTASSPGSASTEVAAEGSAPSMVPDSAYNKTAEEESLQDHPKGCGCVAAGMDTRASAYAGVAAIAALGLALGTRRRK